MMTKEKLINKFGAPFEERINELTDDEAKVLSNVLERPNVKVSINKNLVPNSLVIESAFGTLTLDTTLKEITATYINNTKFNVNDKALTNIEKMVSDFDYIKDNVTFDYSQKRRSGRRVRTSRNQESIEELTQKSFEQLQSSNITFNTLIPDLQGLLQERNVKLTDIISEVYAQDLQDEDLAHFLTHESSYKYDIISAIQGVNVGVREVEYNFEEVKADDSFLGQILQRLDVETALYDKKEKTLKIGDRHITNLPYVNEKGIYSNDDIEYIPYKIGYFVDGAGSRVDRLRYIDPVKENIESCILQYKLTNADVKFTTVLDVTRNLIDFENHPYGEEILETLKRKIVISSDYSETNSLHADFNGKTDELGAVALTILDDDARGLIDPYGTSNGANMGKILYLTEDATFNPDGTLSKGESQFSKVGKIIDDHSQGMDNFNRNQMSFTAFLTSTDVKTMNVAYSEFALWNSDDAIVLTENGAKKFDSEKFVGDKLMDMHGNKGVVSLVIGENMDNVEARHLEHAQEFAKLNPNLDAVLSGVSINSRLNLGVCHSALAGKTEDLKLPNGEVIKDGICEMMYMSLPQTAEHKSKDYGQEGNGRRFSNLYRYAMMSKVGQELYDKAMISDDLRTKNIDLCASTFYRLGIDFKDDTKLIQKHNIINTPKSEVTISSNDIMLMPPTMIKLKLEDEMINNRINIDLGSAHVVNPLTGKPIKDEEGRNILPIRVEDGQTIPYRYMDVFKQIASGNKIGIEQSFAYAAAYDYKNLTKKDNILRNINTATFTTNAKTDVMVPDPTLGLNEIRTSVPDEYVCGHRDPAIQSGNTISFKNVGGNEPNVSHVNPLICKQIDGDFDGDTLGINGYANLALTDTEKQEYYKRSNVEEQLNYYGDVFLSTDSAHFKACALATGLDTSDMTFKDGKSNKELREIVENHTKSILTNPNSYGAYAISFTNEQTVIDSLSKMADQGIKGNSEDIKHHFENGYTTEENRNVLKALIAKSEWTGMAGSMINNLIANLPESKFDQKTVRTAMDVTHSMTQSVLQMKKNADKLPVIDGKIKEMKKVLSGKFNSDRARDDLKTITEGLLPTKAVDEFVDSITKGEYQSRFGRGLINRSETSNNMLAYATEDKFANAIKYLSGEFNKEKESNGLIINT